MPVVRAAKSKPGIRQLTLTGKIAPDIAPSPSKTSKVERVHTDAVLPVQQEFTDLMVARKKNHEYRTNKLRESVERIWLYTTTPTCALTHVMVTSRPKVPGEVRDPSGVGNDDFDRGLKKSKFGYPVLGLYRLKVPLKPAAMKEFQMTAPQGLVYAPKSLVDGLPLEEMVRLF